jgi:low temperature requirement protein LtrA
VNPAARATSPAAGAESRVSPLELFFDLVFVFGFTQVTGSLGDDPSWTDLGHAVLVFAVLWWAWGAYAWLTNTVRTGEMAPRLVVLGATAAMLLTALAVPSAFGDGGVAFALGYLVVMVLHSALFALAGVNPETTRRAIGRLAPSNLLAAALLLAGGFTDGTAQTALWLAAVLVTYAGPYVTGVAGFTVEPGHFVERHGLIVLIALGESVVAIGAASDELTIDWSLAGTALLAITLLGGLWWAYFDVDAGAGERALVAATGPERARLARDVYSYLHIPLVFGIVLAAVGLHEALVHPGEELDTVPGVALGAGVALFFGGLAAIRARRGAPMGPACLGAALAAVLIGFSADEWAAASSLAILAAAALGMAIVERGAGRRTAA